MRIIIFLALILLITAQAPTCNKGGLVYDKNKCHYPEYIEGCLVYAVDNTCAQCEYNYQLQNGLCFYNHNQSNNSQPCCLAFDSNSKCTQCAGGLQLNPTNNNCQDIKIIGCLQKNTRGCSICAYNFDLVAERCLPAIQGCISYDVQNRCVVCNNISILISGFCLPNMQLPLFSNCKLQNEYGCAECNPGYRVDNQGNCQLGINGCLLYNPIGECLRCVNPSFELIDGTCKVVGCLKFANGFCNSCDSTLGFQLFNNLCQIPNCTYFNKEGCLICANGLVVGPYGCTRPSPAVCLICKSDEYLGADTKCYKRDVLCVQYKTGLCTACYEGFFLNVSSGCQPVVPGCVYNKGFCTSCRSPFNLVNGTCTIVGCVQYQKDGCISCDSRLNLIASSCGLTNCQQLSVDFRCRQCNSGYELDQYAKCIVVDPNCLTRNNLNICLQCKEGFQIGRDGKCFSVKVGCNYIDGRCTSCRAPFIYIPNSESCEIDGCLSYFVGGCEKCENGYTLLYNSCKLPKCLISKKGKCLECDPDFSFRSDGNCVNKDEFCDKKDMHGTCIKCMDIYYYSQKLLKCVKKAPGCNYDNQDKCVSCEAPFAYQPGRCVIKGCINFNKDGCYQCEYPFSLTKTKTCQIANCLSYGINGHCSSCTAGYTLSKEFVCQIQDKNCKQYNSLRSTCLTCIKGYRLDSRGRCQYADDYCISFDSNGICMNCDRLYFLNYFGKCQLRDPQCLVYTNGYCSSCKSYYFPQDGFCMPNFVGCKFQQSYGKCLTCDDGYQLSKGICVGTITRLNWNSLNMDFGDDDQSSKMPNSKAQPVFTVGVTSTLNLIAAFGTSKGKLFFSSSALNDAIVLLKADGNNGWSPSSSNSVGQFVGFQAKNLQSFYACDVKPLTGSTLQSFILEYSMDGQSYFQIGEFSMADTAINSIITFYFKPVHAKFIRLVVKKGIPNIRIDFYYSSVQKLISASSFSYNSTFISQTVVATIDGVENGGLNKCDKQSLCWAGIQSCKPRNIKGFSLFYNGNNTDKVTEVKIEYSMDSLNFVCWNNCASIVLSIDGFVFPSPILAQKMHVHFSKYSGNPKFGIKFNYV